MPTVKTRGRTYHISISAFKKALCRIAGRGQVVLISTREIARALGLPTPQSAATLLKMLVREVPPLWKARRGYVFRTADIKKYCAG